MEKFAKIFVERPVTTFIVVLVAIVLGVNAFLKLELAMMPDVEYPSMMIIALWIDHCVMHLLFLIYSRH